MWWLFGALAVVGLCVIHVSVGIVALKRANLGGRAGRSACCFAGQKCDCPFLFVRIMRRLRRPRSPSCSRCVAFCDSYNHKAVATALALRKSWRSLYFKAGLPLYIAALGLAATLIFA
jgi:hypothetical protein